MADSGELNNEMNKFIATHKILEIEQHFVFDGKNGLWSFCIRYLQATTSDGTSPTQNREKVDYKQVLDETHFSIFSKLRVIRKELAEQDAVPAYAIFTDEELSKIAQLENITGANIKSIQGIGEKKRLKYGESLANKYHET